MQNSIDVLRPFAKTLEERDITEVQIIGGVNSAALIHPNTVINFNSREVIAPADLYISTIRDDKAKTLRDLDIFAKSSKPDDLEYIEGLVDETVGTSLKQSIFGFVPGETLKRQIRHPMGVAALKTFLSDRYTVSDEIELPDGMVSDDGMVKSLFPLAVPLCSESLETWMLSVGDMHAPIPNPAMSIINYTTRSISGVRHKDAKKIKNMAASVLTKSPKLREWALDGPGARQVELGLLLRSLTPRKEHIDYFGTGKPIIPIAELVDNEQFMLPNIGSKEKRRIIGMAALKARILDCFDSSPTVVTLFQKFIEPRVDNIVKNK